MSNRQLGPPMRTLPPADMQQAHEGAKKVLASIDYTKGTIIIWLPGTGRRGIPGPLAGAVARTFGASASLVALDYPAGNKVRESTATGIATLRLVLAGIAAHTGKKVRVHLAGESQGAWAISETVKDPAMRARVSRMVLLGHPWVASTHYDDGHDPNVMEINRRVDIITRPLNGDAQGAVEAVEQIFQRKIGNIGKLVRALVDNPLSAYLLALTGIRLLTPGGPDRDPHNYEDAMNAAVQFLRV